MWTVENPGMTACVQVALGLVFFGRKLFWVFVGVFGFLTGMQIAAQVRQGHPELIHEHVSRRTGRRAPGLDAPLLNG